jgi:IclR family mhp operon transcriptional activator
MASFPPVESVVRAIQLLQALNREPVSTVAGLHRQTGIPKPSIVRLLQTFGRVGLVSHAPHHGTYYLTSGVRTLSAGYHSEPRIVEAAAPVLDELTRRLKWPVAVAVFDHDAVVVRYSTVTKSPLALLHSTIGLRLSLVSRGLGRAYLAFCEPEVREAILATLAQSTNPEDAAARDRPANVRHALDEVRRLGYAIRDPRVRPVSNTIAVPVFDAGRVVASIGLTYFSSTMKTPQAVARYLGELQAATEQISAALARLGP